MTASLEAPFESDEYPVTFAKDSTWQIAAEWPRFAEAGRTPPSGSPLDLDLSILGPDGKELATQDDAPSTTDPSLVFKAPADGAYRIVVAERSGMRLGRSGWYRLRVEPQMQDFKSTIPALLPVPLGGRGKLAIPLVRLGGFKEPVRLQLNGLPEGVKPLGELLVPADKNELAVELESAADSPAGASLVQVVATTKLGEQEVTRTLGTVLVATTMKPRIKITPEGLDDVRKVHRGSTYLAPLLIERLEGYAGPITLEMTSKQQRHRQGLASDEFAIEPARRGSSIRSSCRNGWRRRRRVA